MPANAFTRRVMPGGVNLADVDQARYSNALLKSRVDSAPAELESLKLGNESMRQNIDIRGKQMTEGQKEVARGILAQRFSAVAQSQNPTAAYRQLLSDPDFKAAGSMIGIPVDQFTFDGSERPDQIASGMMDWARAMGSEMPQDTASDTRFGSPQVGPNNELLVLDRRTGKYVNAGANASPNMRLVTQPDGSVIAVDMRQPGGRNTPIVSPDDALDASADKIRNDEAAKAEAEARANMGSAMDDLDKFEGEIRGFLGSPGFDTVYGMSRLVNPNSYRPGSEAMNSEVRRSQLDAASFGIAIQKMKGLGALSNAEGLKVSAAFTRATDPRQSEEAAREAWKEVLAYLESARANLQKRAGAQPQQATQGSGGWTITEVK